MGLSAHDKLKCSFCDMSQDEVRKLITGPGVYICNICVEKTGDQIDAGSLPTLPDEINCSFCGKKQPMTGPMFQQSNTVICNECIELCWEILEDDLAGIPPSDSGFAQYFSTSGVEPVASFASIGTVLDAADSRRSRSDTKATLVMLHVWLTATHIAPDSLEVLTPLNESIIACDKNGDLLIAAELLKWKLLIEQRHTPGTAAVQRTHCALIASYIRSGKREHALDHLSMLNQLIQTMPKPPNES